jgi:signal peptidase II
MQKDFYQGGVTRKHFTFVSALAIFLTIADTVIKLIALEILPTTGSIPVFRNAIGLQLHMNSGIVANIAIPMPIIVLLTFAILTLLTLWFKSAWKNKNYFVSTSLIVLMSGATGNLVDRIAHGFTTDYIMLFERSVINVADILIVIGVIGLLVSSKEGK